MLKMFGDKFYKIKFTKNKCNQALFYIINWHMCRNKTGKEPKLNTIFRIFFYLFKEHSSATPLAEGYVLYILLKVVPLNNNLYFKELDESYIKFYKLNLLIIYIFKNICEKKVIMEIK